MKRREFVASSAGLAVAGSAIPAAATSLPTGTSPLRQAVTRWPFSSMPLDAFCGLLREIGFGAVDLVDQKDWATVQRHGLAVSTANSSQRRDFISRGLNDRTNHALILGELEGVIPAAKRAGIPNVIAMFGNRGARSDADGIAACAEGLAKIAPVAERHGVTVILEMLNSRVDHADFHGDRVGFGVAVVEAVASPNVKLLYDIYHMQIMDGDIIRTIGRQAKWFAHYHTAGNPGRNELSSGQELQYAAIARAIAATGFTGWIAHEFTPRGDTAAALREAFTVCSV